MISLASILLSDNGPQFARWTIKWFLKELNIEHRFISIRHVQTIGHVEMVNKVVMDCLKKVVEHKMYLRLLYEFETVALVEIALPMHQVGPPLKKEITISDASSLILTMKVCGHQKKRKEICESPRHVTIIEDFSRLFLVNQPTRMCTRTWKRNPQEYIQC